MTLGTLALAVYLVLVALTHFGVRIPALALGICAMIAGVALLFGSGVILYGTRTP